GMFLAKFGWQSDHKLGVLVDLAKRWDRLLQQGFEGPVNSVPPGPGTRPVQITSIKPKPESPTEVRVTGVGPPPPYHVYFAVRDEGAADQKIGGEASYDGGGKWT